MIDFSVIVCTYNRSDYLTKVLSALNNQTFEGSRFEIILINNNSTDETEKVCLNFQKNTPELNITYFVESNKGLSYARNKGIELSNGNWIIFLDDDAEPTSEYLDNIFNFINDYPECIAAGGRIYPNYETSEPKWMSRFLLPLVSAIDLGNKIKKFPNNKYPIGANMIFRKDIFDKVGNFNVDLGRKGDQLLGGEEKEIFIKLRELTDEIYYIPTAIVYHFIPSKRLKLSFIKDMAQKIGESNLIIYKKENINRLRLNELFKWAASVILFLYYLIKFKGAQGVMLLRFRFWVLQGILSSNNK